MTGQARPPRHAPTPDRVAQAPELVGVSLIPAGAVLDLLEALCELFGDRADVRTLWHLAPALGLCGVVLERQRRARGRAAQPPLELSRAITPKTAHLRS